MEVTVLRRLFSFPNPVNEVSARLVAAGVVGMCVATVVFDQPWLTVVIAYGFVARVLTGPTLSPLGQFVTRVVTPRLNRPARLVPGPPKRFAQGIGAAVSTASAVLLAAGLAPAAWVLLAVLIAAASLEAFAGFCLGCTIFGFLQRRGLIPEDVCEACNNISLRGA